MQLTLRSLGAACCKLTTLIVDRVEEEEVNEKNRKLQRLLKFHMTAGVEEEGGDESKSDMSWSLLSRAIDFSRALVQLNVDLHTFVAVVVEESADKLLGESGQDTNQSAVNVIGGYQRCLMDVDGTPLSTSSLSAFDFSLSASEGFYH
ncbi:hypothetical protein Tco_0093492 [Tanacetum coccineum]